MLITQTFTMARWQIVVTPFMSHVILNEWLLSFIAHFLVSTEVVY